MFLKVFPDVHDGDIPEVPEDDFTRSSREFQIFVTVPKMFPEGLDGHFKHFRQKFQSLQTEITNLPALDARCARQAWDFIYTHN